jgi:asparagine synthase (glutamine-hydrolysing)
MPGIAGIISRKKAPEECQRLVASMTQSMMHESFYTSGTHAFDEVGIFAGWVAHAGSMAADQVFWNERHDVALVFAGECFADAATRTELTRKGHEIGTASGGWLLHLYEETGESFFEGLNGLFSGLLVDLRSKRSFLFNDRYGIERIYWHETEDATYFATEAKALLRVLPQLRGFDGESLAQFLSFGCTLEWRTLFRGVQLAPGGSLWIIENGHCNKAKYFTPSKWEGQTSLSEAEFEAKFDETFQNILPRYFESASRVGISLTGGLDTRMIMACLPPSTFPPICYTYAGVTGETLDVRVASRVARACGLEHGLLRIGPDFFSRFGNLVERTAYLSDGCFGAMGAHEVYLNAMARDKSPLRLTGVFGSEILRGVSTFKPVKLTQKIFQTGLQPVSNAAAVEGWSQLHAVTFAAFREIPWNIFGSLSVCRSQVTFRTPFLDNAVVALAYQAPESLRRSPQSAIRFIRGTGSATTAIATDRGHLGRALTRPLRRVLAEVTFKLDYYHNEGMPQALTRFEPGLQAINRMVPFFGHHKFLHYRRWFRRELSAHLREIAEEAGISSVCNAKEVRRMAEEHISGARNRVLDIGAVLTLLAIERRLIRGQN